MRLFKRLGIAILISAILNGIVYFLLYRYDSYGWLIKWFQVELWYTISLLGILIGLLTALQYVGKLARVVALMLLIAGTILSIRVFNDGFIGLSPIYFGALCVAILLALFLTLLNHWIKYPLIILLILAIGSGLLLTQIPLYNEAPNLSGFTQSQDFVVQNLAITDIIPHMSLGIINQDDEKQSDISISELQQALSSNKKTTITFASESSDNTAGVWITTPEGAHIILFPQSAIVFSKQESGTILQTNIEFLFGQMVIWMPNELIDTQKIINTFQGKSFAASSCLFVQSWQQTIVYTSPDIMIFSWNDNLKISKRGIGIKKLQAEWLIQQSTMHKKYLEKRRQYLINQAGWDIVLHPLADKFIASFLSFLFSISPEKFGKNVINYHAFWKYFGEHPKLSSSKNYNTLYNSQENIEKKSWEGLKETKLYQRRDKIRN